MFLPTLSVPLSPWSPSCPTKDCDEFTINIISNLDGAVNRGHKQTDLIIMDFAKAFDKVPHRRLLHKLDYYGIRWSTHKWINSWLSGSTHQVVLDGKASDPVPVLSGVPQGSVLGAILFLIFINDLPDNIRFSVRLFADDCVLYRNIHSIQYCFILQEYLTSLGQWEADWQMKFNVAKCHYMRVTRHQASQTDSPWLLPSQPNFGKRSVSKIHWHNHLWIWIWVNTFQKFLPKQLRHLVSFAGIWLLHLGVLRKLHTKLWFGLN